MKGNLYDNLLPEFSTYKLGETSEIVCSFPFLAWSIQWVEENSQEVVVKEAYVQELTLDLTLSTSHSNFSYNCSSCLFLHLHLHWKGLNCGIEIAVSTACVDEKCNGVTRE